MSVATKPNMDAKEVAEFLRSHPDFLKKNPELLSVIAPPARALGDGVVDFQQFQLKNLQANAQDLKGKYQALVDFCRDNLSVQSQVHDAVLRLIRAKSLEQLLEVVTLDLVSLFDVDVVRLAIESSSSEFYETHYSEENYSGIVFIDTGTAAATIGNKKALLVPEVAAQPIPGFEQIFADCAGMIQSFALLKLDMQLVDRTVMLAFGVRHAGRFQASQGLELLSFLAEIVAHQLDSYLSDMGV